MDAGADLGEFVSGAGETLRAVLLAGLGGRPEGLTEGMQLLIVKYSSLLPAADVVRMLGVLTEMESQLRTGGTMRLTVELLLLRWAMMSRTVELGEVLRELGAVRGGGPADSRPGGREPSGDAPVLRDSAATVRPSASPPVRQSLSPPDRPSAGPAERGPLTLERLRSLWPRIVDDARAKSPLLGALLAQAEIAGLEGTTVAIRLLDLNPVHAETEPIRVQVASSGAAAMGSPAGSVTAVTNVATRPARLTEESARQERLQMLRARDPGLNAAVEALDLELLE